MTRRRRRYRKISTVSDSGVSIARVRDRNADVMLRAPVDTTATPAYAIGRMISDALDPTQAPGKVRTLADMTPEEIARLVPPRKK